MNQKEFNIFPIGAVKSVQGSFQIEIFKEFRPAMAELNGFSHIQVLWWCHLLDDDNRRKTVISDRPYKNGPEKMGIFATRSPVRPNPIAITTVPVISADREKGSIIIPWIDAENDSPVIDIKPYHAFERIKDVKVPGWCSHWPKWYEDSAAFDWASEFENAR